MSAAQACEFSLRARCQPMTCSCVHAMSATASRPSHIPSTKTTWCTSSQTGASGHSFQKRAVCRRKVLADIPISDCVFFARSQSANSLRSLEELSYLCVVDAPQDLQRHLVAPELVLPLRFVSPPHAGHSIFFIP